MVWAILTDDGLDQICETAATAKKEVKDLKAMGHDAKAKTFASEREVYEWCERKGWA